MQLEEIILISEEDFELQGQLTSNDEVLMDPVWLICICNLGFLHLFGSICLLF